MEFNGFKEKVNSDSEFGTKVKSLQSLEAVVEFGKEHGYTFTVDDIKADSRLSDDELDAVAGGGTPPPSIHWIFISVNRP